MTHTTTHKYIVTKKRNDENIYYDKNHEKQNDTQFVCKYKMTLTIVHKVKEPSYTDTHYP